jgi:hypothetical protein
MNMQGRIKVLGGSPFVGASQESMVSKKTYYRHRKCDDACQTFTKNLNFGAAGRFFRIEAPKVLFFNFCAEGEIIYNIDTEATNFRMNFVPQANILQVNDQKKDRKN